MFAERPITIANQTSYVSYRDPAIDWDRVIAREHELTPDFGDKVREALLKAMREEPGADPVVLRRAVEKEQLGMRIGPMIRVNPSITLETYLPREGARCTIFYIGVLQPAIAARIEDETNGLGNGVPRLHERYWRAFLEASRSIDNFSEGKIPMRTVEDVSFVDASWLRSRFVGQMRAIAEEVGSVIWAWNRFTEDDAKK